MYSLGQPRGTQRYQPTRREDEDALTRGALVGQQYGHYGYRWITALLNGYCESFNSKLLNEFLNGEIFYSMAEY